MTTIEFINERIDELRSKLESLNKKKKTDDILGVDLCVCWEIKLVEDEIYNYQQVLKDLEKLETIESDIRWKMLNGEY